MRTKPLTALLVLTLHSGLLAQQEPIGDPKAKAPRLSLHDVQRTMLDGDFKDKPSENMSDVRKTAKEWTEYFLRPDKQGAELKITNERVITHEKAGIDMLQQKFTYRERDLTIRQTSRVFSLSIELNDTSLENINQVAFNFLKALPRSAFALTIEKTAPKEQGKKEAVYVIAKPKVNHLLLNSFSAYVHGKTVTFFCLKGRMDPTFVSQFPLTYGEKHNKYWLKNHSGRLSPD